MKYRLKHIFLLQVLNLIVWRSLKLKPKPERNTVVRAISDLGLLAFEVDLDLALAEPEVEELLVEAGEGADLGDDIREVEVDRGF